MAKENIVRQKRAVQNEIPNTPSKTIQNEIIHVYVMKIKEQLAGELWSQNLPVTITDR